MKTSLNGYGLLVPKPDAFNEAAGRLSVLDDELTKPMGLWYHVRG